MSAPGPDIACVLASGFSTRFGAANKLLAAHKGAPLILSAIRPVLQAGFDQIYVIISINNKGVMKILNSIDFTPVVNTNPEQGQSTAVKLAAQTAIKHGAHSLMITLGDMPFVSASHLQAMQTALPGHSAVISSDGDHTKPPALFARNAFASLLKLEGDVGARHALKSMGRVHTILAEPGALRDINTHADLDDVQ